uniref:Integrase_H2C2 domain-containing protein n=1 Tax=Strongyloides papillosus TaxID=174720 RepID=A0A0N5BYU8_STREA
MFNTGGFYDKLEEQKLIKYVHEYLDHASFKRMKHFLELRGQEKIINNLAGKIRRFLQSCLLCKKSNSNTKRTGLEFTHVNLEYPKGRLCALCRSINNKLEYRWDGPYIVDEVSDDYVRVKEERGVWNRTHVKKF